MAFQSKVVSLNWINNSILLMRGVTQLQISKEDTTTLRTLKDIQSFTEFFRTTALKNRKARRTFEAWESKDEELLTKLFNEMQEV